MTIEQDTSTREKLRALDPKPDSVELAKRMISGEEQDPRADSSVHNFMEVVKHINSPEAREFSSLIRQGRVELFVPRVLDDSEFGVMAATERVLDADGVIHTEVLVNPIVWSDETLIGNDTPEAVRNVMVGSCRRAVERAVMFAKSS